jgi:choline dehydrogenase-like flavoprotein
VVESGNDAPNEDIHALNAVENVGHPIRKNFVNRLRMLGGTSNVWAGRCMALEPADFEARPHVPRSGWPISYGEIEPYLVRAAHVMGLPLAEAGPLNSSQTDHYKTLVILADFDHRIALWARVPPNFWRIHGGDLSANEKCMVLTGMTVTRLDVAAGGRRVARVIAKPSCLANPRGQHPSERKGLSIRADRYVLAMGGIETTRMMLLATRDNPHAAWPREPLGRFYMDHPRAVRGGIRLNAGVDFSQYLSRPMAGGMVQVSLGILPHQQQQHGLLNPYFYLEQGSWITVAKSYEVAGKVLQRKMDRGHLGRRFDFSNLASVQDLIHQLAPREILPHDLYKIYYRLRSRLKPHRRELAIVNNAEQIPDPDSRIDLGESTDRFGNPVPRVAWRVNEAEIESVRFFHMQLALRLEADGLGRLITDPKEIDASMFTDSSHHMGSTRMAAAASDGVVDGNLQVHGVSDLFLCSSSVFPTGGSVNPTWTLVALALRLADYLKAGTART